MMDVDFEYDGLYLSEFGFMVCSFDSTDQENISEGAEITFDLTPVAMGTRHLLSDTKYDSCVTAEFDICKIPTCKNDTIDNEEFFVTYDEERDITRWLIRKQMFPFMLLSDHYEGVIFNGSFNVEKVEQDGKIIGFHLKFQSDRPFGYLDARHRFKIASENGKRVIYDESDEIGTQPISMTITLESGGDLVITNSFDGRETKVKNCTSGEVITFNDMQISSSDDNHQKTIMNDFNFRFPMISNTYKEVKNEYTFSLPCNVIAKYKQIRKVGV